jgi:hypothetical protein
MTKTEDALLAREYLYSFAQTILADIHEDATDEQANVELTQALKANLHFAQLARTACGMWAVRRSQLIFVLADQPVAQVTLDG